MINSWSDLPRYEKNKKTLPTTIISNDVSVINLEYGINLYRNAIKKEECVDIINTLEKEISLGIPGIEWHGAQINAQENNDYVRNCMDLKFKKEDLGKHLPENKELYRIHESVERSLDNCLKHYESLWHLQMHYKEAFNFVKYLPGKYFKIHGDHGPYYSCTVSAVIYLNDDYVGGEIEFPRHDLTIKPEAGDIIMFPSNYVYEHASLEVFSGIKYSVVVMMDYNDMFHRTSL